MAECLVNALGVRNELGMNATLFHQKIKNEMGHSIKAKMAYGIPLSYDENNTDIEEAGVNIISYGYCEEPSYIAIIPKSEIKVYACDVPKPIDLKYVLETPDNWDKLLNEFVTKHKLKTIGGPDWYLLPELI
jgi:hypothetical protein